MNKITDKEFYNYNKNNKIYLPIFKYINSNKYLNDIYKIFIKSIKHIKNNYNSNIKQCAIIDLDETFLFNDFYLFHTLDTYKHYNYKIYKHYKNNFNKLYSPIIPYMYILYSYIINKNIDVIFLTARDIKYKKTTIDNLKYFGITKYFIIFKTGDIKSNIYKQYNIRQIEKNNNIILILNDQNEFYHRHLIKMPQLYTSI